MKLPQNILLSILFICCLGSMLTYLACTKTDPCANVVCINNGSCDGGKCVCPVGYEGPRCDTLSRDKFIFQYNGGDTCTYNYDSLQARKYRNSIRLTARFYKPLELMMTNFLGNPDDSAVCTMIQTDSFTFIGANNSTSYYGTGWKRSDSLFMAFHVVHDTTSYDCTYLGKSY